MSPQLQYFLRIFSISTASYAGIYTLVSTNLFQQPADWVHIFILSVVFGGVMSLVSTLIQTNRLYHKGVNPEKEADLLPDQSHELMIRRDIEDVWEELIGRLAQEKGWRLHSTDPIRQTMSFRRTMNLYSWGETVVIRLKDMSEGYTLLRINSKPIVSTTLIDYGRNKANVQRIESIAKNLEHSSGFFDVDSLREIE